MSWTVNSIKVESRSGSTSLSIFANGRMQAPVYVLLEARKDGKPYQLTSNDLTRVKITNYHTDEPLSGSFRYSSTDLGYTAPFPSSSKSDKTVDESHEQAEDRLISAYQTHTLYVFSTQIGDIRIGASILQPDNVLVTTRSGSNDSSIYIDAKPRPYYTLDDVKFEREDTADGAIHGSIGSFPVSLKWDQDNYYLTSKKYPFKMASVYGTQQNGQGEVGKQHCYAIVEDNTVTNWCFVWPMGSAQSKKVGSATSAIGEAYANIRVNQKGEHVLTVTRWKIQGKMAAWPPVWSYWCYFDIYDIYGNEKRFYLDRSDRHNLLHLKENQPWSQAAVSDNGLPLDGHSLEAGFEPVPLGPDGTPDLEALGMKPSA
ncbi:uncharacterized protein NFIA_004710 [Aspergillus fischeri NRRL 181]|uniref:Uncharacterized protein n=1 Tax=Neosartorya fischeri (strain ATCC 1020 / DSM 3700 / CBS 544.65 / FGSC A1164 / JCM 1740 / NRRL 181 / WB 181) TaxID=331117 RepID=A1DK74_NEOFI|nr:uncharacterized protein NFIA_004710 [Aspergillus fischeri NRRL 181]EAW17113.1 hypothetical protein NFIA_004710 [Aspergillus fischeri NRRL 181]KAG2005265.1 hypothetical protein GB937_008808 [Aspergillus fischeri]